MDAVSRAVERTCGEKGQTTTEYLMVTGLLATVIITVFALIYWPSVKEPARQTLGNCVPGAIKGKLDADSCGQPVAAAPPAPVGTTGSTPPPAAPPSPPSPPPAAPPRLVGSQYCGHTTPTEGKCGIEGASDPAGLEVSWSFSPLTTCDLSGFTIRNLPGGGVEWTGPAGQAGSPNYCDLVLQACNSEGACTQVPFKHWSMP